MLATSLVPLGIGAAFALQPLETIRQYGRFHRDPRDADVVVLAIPVHRFAAFDPSLLAGKLVVDDPLGIG